MPGFPVHHQLWSLLKLMSIKLVMPFNHLILSFPSPPTFNLSQHQGLFRWVRSLHQMAKYWSFIFSISPSNEYSGLISFRIRWFDLLAVQGTLKSLLNTRVQKHEFLSAQHSLWSNLHIHARLVEKLWLWPDRSLLAKSSLCFLICCLGWSQLFLQGVTVF